MQDITPLHIAAERGDYWAVERQLGSGADANAKEVEVFAISALHSLLHDLTNTLE